ncbi:hypothetical protein ZIOFF_005088 [Zingiber officinale]|uniref:RING-type E3 ubiquitin transferase n=1 Tax=Zingiber officinale TaxID=94328 RepID=A0A8J5LRF8_ZINOF|nr:hypothetical protein ZIOFF_005088 [Zingiber officinale]
MQNVSYGAVVGSEANLAGMWPTFADGVVPPRYSRQLPSIGLFNRASPGRGATQDMVFLGQMILALIDWISIGPLNCPGAIMDQSTFYDPRSLFDEHHDMRLDIENKNYGNLELLSLIHHVFVWFSDRYFLYCQQESYKHRERLGRLKCGHDFHACCIKQLLLIKNICPVCKALALEDS